MELTTPIQEKLDQLDEKFRAIGQKTETHLEGLLWAKPITYWDYINTDALLNLQIQRTTLPDEMVFIMYHQVNELLFKMILWEVEQLCHTEVPTTPYFTEKLMRISRYFDMLTTSFTIMKAGSCLNFCQMFMVLYSSMKRRNSPLYFLSNSPSRYDFSPVL